MGDTENTLPPSKKRSAGRELSRDNPGLDDEDESFEQESGTFKRASDEVLASRKIVRVRRHQPPSTPSAPSSNPFAGIRLVPTTDSISTAPESTKVEGEKTCSEEVGGKNNVKKETDKENDDNVVQTENKADEAGAESVVDEKKPHTVNEGGKPELADEKATGEDKTENEDNKDIEGSTVENKDDKDNGNENTEKGAEAEESVVDEKKPEFADEKAMEEDKTENEDNKDIEGSTAENKDNKNNDNENIEKGAEAEESVVDEKKPELADEKGTEEDKTGNEDNKDIEGSTAENKDNKNNVNENTEKGAEAEEFVVDEKKPELADEKATEEDKTENEDNKDIEGSTAENKDDKDNGNENIEKGSEAASFSSFQQLSSSQNAFTGLTGTGFSGSTFSFGVIPKDGSPLGSGSLFGLKNDQTSYPSFGSSLPNNGNSSLFGTAGVSLGKSEGSGFPSMQEVPVETGEENEKAVFTADSVLFEFTEGGWKERGKGELKVNVPTTGTGIARLVMRARGNYRLILNASLYPDMKLTNMDKRGITFACMNCTGEGKDGLSTFALKFKDGSVVEEFHEAVTEHKDKTAAVLNTPENSPKESDD